MSRKHPLAAIVSILPGICMSVLLFFPLQAPAQSKPILFYQNTHDLTPGDDTFRVEVHENGTALVHYPSYMKSAGDYYVQLSPSEIQQLRLVLEHPLVQSFDEGQVNVQKKNIDAQSAELFVVSDNSYAEFEIDIQDQDADGKHIRWTNLHIDAERYPQIGVLRKLADIEASLLQLDEHPTAERIE